MRSGISLHTWWRAEVGFSPNHFSTVFSQETGQTFVEYLTAVRIEAAKHLLTKGNSNRMSDIAFDVGYQDSHYFSYLFKSTSVFRRASTAAGRKRWAIPGN